MRQRSYEGAKWCFRYVIFCMVLMSMVLPTEPTMETPNGTLVMPFPQANAENPAFIWTEQYNQNLVPVSHISELSTITEGYRYMTSVLNPSTPFPGNMMVLAVVDTATANVTAVYTTTPIMFTDATYKHYSASLDYFTASTVFTGIIQSSVITSYAVSWPRADAQPMTSLKAMAMISFSANHQYQLVQHNPYTPSNDLFVVNNGGILSRYYINYTQPEINKRFGKHLAIGLSNYSSDHTNKISGQCAQTEDETFLAQHCYLFVFSGGYFYVVNIATSNTSLTEIKKIHIASWTPGAEFEFAVNLGYRTLDGTLLHNDATGSGDYAMFTHEGGVFILDLNDVGDTSAAPFIIEEYAVSEHFCAPHSPQFSSKGGKATRPLAGLLGFNNVTNLPEMRLFDRTEPWTQGALSSSFYTGSSRLMSETVEGANTKYESYKFQGLTITNGVVYLSANKGLFALKVAIEVKKDTLTPETQMVDPTVLPATPQTDVPRVVQETDVPKTEAAEGNASATNDTVVVDTEAPVVETEAPETEAPETPLPLTPSPTKIVTQAPMEEVQTGLPSWSTPLPAERPTKAVGSASPTEVPQTIVPSTDVPGNGTVGGEEGVDVGPVSPHVWLYFVYGMILMTVVCGAGMWWYIRRQKGASLFPCCGRVCRGSGKRGKTSGAGGRGRGVLEEDEQETACDAEMGGVAHLSDHAEEPCGYQELYCDLTRPGHSASEGMLVFPTIPIE